MKWLCCVLSCCLMPPATMPAGAQEPGATIRTTASEVLLDLSVRDKRGKLVKNLKASDVTVLEDGVPQKILSFRAVGAKEAQKQKAGVEAVKTAGRAPSARALHGVNLIGIVLHNLDPVSRLRAADAAREFIKNDMDPDTYIGIFLLGDRLSPVCPFTNDRHLLMSALQDPYNGRVLDFDRASVAALTANPNEVTVQALVNMAGRATTASVDVRLRGGEVGRTVVTGADVSTGPGANALRGDQVRERQDFSNIHGMRETDKILTLIQQFGALPGRKTVLLASTGLTTTGDPDTFDMVLGKANKAGITFYSLDVNDMGMTSQAQAGNLAVGQVAGVSRTQSQAAAASQAGEAGAARTRSRQGDALEQSVRTSDPQAPLRALSEGTGGFLIANTTEFKKPFRRILDELETYYEVAYRPEKVELDGRLHLIEVKLARNDLSVDSRTGYFAMPDGGRTGPMTQHEVMGLLLLNSKPAPKAFEFRTSVFQFAASDANSVGAIAFEVPGSSLAATPDPVRQLTKVHFSLLALVKDAGGDVVDQYSLDAPFDIAEANMAGVRGSAVTYTHPVGLPPGRYSVETAVLDHESGRASTSVNYFQMPGARKGLGLSSVVLAQRVEDAGGNQKSGDPMIFEGKRVVPLLASRISAEMKPFAYFIVYPDPAQAEKPRLQVEFLVGGKSIAKQSAELLAADASGAIPMMVSAAVAPGPCELRITASQGNASTMGQVMYVGGRKQGQ